MFDKKFYKLLKNMIHNELEISKDEVRQWTEEAVYKIVNRKIEVMDLESIVVREVRKFVASDFLNKDLVGAHLRADITREIINKVMQSISVHIEGCEPSDQVTNQVIKVSKTSYK